MAANEKSTPSLHSKRFPDEDPRYRAARDRLLAEEIALRRHTEEVAALRRALPSGGVVPQDYAFDEMADDGSIRRVRLSELFVRPDASLVVYGFMFGPKMPRACPMCTAMLDSLDRAAPHAAQRINLVVVARSPIERIRAFAHERGWSSLRLLSSAHNTFNVDYHAEDAQGAQMPMLNVFARRDGHVRHLYGTEMLYAAPDPGQDARHVDIIWPLWNVFDLTPEGRGRDWYPALEYRA